ncbi:MAG: antibiotic biosynthesis monooxygenase [Thermomicrobiales bacterium]
MEADRFDTIAKTLAMKLSRRSTMRRGGIGIAATMLAAVGLRSATASTTAATAQQSNFTGYSVIRRYALSGSTDAVQQVLATGFVPIIQQEKGYVSYSVVVSPNNVLTTITVFESQAELEAASQSEATWVQQNLASLLPAPAEETTGNTAVFDVNPVLICGPAPTPTATVQPTNPATAVPCTGIGCACNGGVQNACDEGLVCCQSQMNGGSIPGGAGMCAAADACGDQGDATPVS